MVNSLVECVIAYNPNAFAEVQKHIGDFFTARGMAIPDTIDAGKKQSVLRIPQQIAEWLAVVMDFAIPDLLKVPKGLENADGHGKIRFLLEKLKSKLQVPEHGKEPLTESPLKGRHENGR